MKKIFSILAAGVCAINAQAVTTNVTWVLEMGDEMPHFGAKRAKPPYLPQKVSDKSLKQAESPRHPLFGCSHSEQSAQQQAQVKASRRNLVSLSEIFCSLEREGIRKFVCGS